MPFHFSQFASTRVEDALQTKLLQLPDFPADLRHCLLTGPEHRCGRMTASTQAWLQQRLIT